MCHDWPKTPIWPEDLPLIRELLSDGEYAELLRRMVQVLPNGPLLDYRATLQARRTLPVSWNAARKALCCGRSPSSVGIILGGPV